ncbi:PspA/IM30 family protein [Rhodocytophaga aerolata]|uniref:PspA/IM30 family protein n=1 Tax=Rhodocytophaga aerolata TaxID=455078 RepID=A0ABT8RG10_9BACT|nr:PspA/IM30 family protein [Rhodocytophaga aerolata]MDO1450083.1 PspA/IM30 family protein [Rhodocytophaga aerolata]
MGIFSRIADIFKANINDTLDRAEDPEKMIKLMVVEMQEALTKSTSALAQAMGNEKRLERQYQQLQSSSEDMQSKAITALKAGNESLAKTALVKKSQVDTQLAQYKQMYESASATTAQMRAQVDKLKAKLDEARMKESTLIARSQQAKAQTQIAKSLGGFDDNAFAKFDKFEQKVLKSEAEAQAFTELSSSNTSLDDQFAELQQNNQVDDELAKLKALLNK